MLGSEERPLAGGPWSTECFPRYFACQACHPHGSGDSASPCKDTGDPSSPQPGTLLLQPQSIILTKKLFMKPVSNGLEPRDALVWRAHGSWCRWQEMNPEGFALEVQSQLERQGRSGHWGTVTQEQSQEMGSSVSDMADRSRNEHCGLRGAACSWFSGLCFFSENVVLGMGLH